MGLLLLIVFRTLIALLFLRDGLVPSLCEFCRGIQILHYLDNRRKVHKDAINICQNILHHKPVEWKSIVRNNLSQPIRDVDLVVTVGGDGTLLQGSHFIDDSVPVLGVNSDPTQPEEVEKLSNEIDANRSTGYLCGATVNNFEQVLDSILRDRAIPSKLTRISVSWDDQPCAPLAHSRSSGLRVSTAAGSTAAMLSAGGFLMPILSQDLQYMVREPISPGAGLKLNARVNQISSVHGSYMVW
ncbi:hypothetical protein GBA52_013637 [Prunus armeniaca]|nr:hypothetical protein GBA52_013637 [Prunus armeniaca]